MNATPQGISISSFVLTLGLMILLAGCGDETSGEALSFETAAQGVVDAGEPSQSFTNDKGWTVTLNHASVAIGPIYYYSSEAQAGLWQRLFGMQTAYACPAHAQFDKGSVLGEIRQQVVIDLLQDSPVSTGTSIGEKGTCRMFELHLHPPGEIPAASDDAAFEVLNGHSWALSGTAEKDGVSIAFLAYLTIPDEGTMRVVESIPAELSLEGQAGKAVVNIHLDNILTNMDFASIVDENGACLEPTQDGVCLVPEDSQAHVAWLTGVRSRYSYSLDWVQ